jgi:hypothetical protein
MNHDKFVFLSRNIAAVFHPLSGLKKWYVKTKGLVCTAKRTSAIEQQLGWAQEYGKRMRKFNLMIVSMAFVALTWLSIVLWHILK